MTLASFGGVAYCHRCGCTLQKMRRSIAVLAGVVVIAVVSLAIAQSPADGNNPTLAVTRDGTRIQVTFTGTLDSAAVPTGPWIELTNATSPFLQNLDGIQRFYRARRPGVDSIFSSAAVVAWTITGPLQQHFELAFAGTPDGIFPPKRRSPISMGGCTWRALISPSAGESGVTPACRNAHSQVEV